MKFFNDWSQSGLDVQDWDGGNPECDSPKLSKGESCVVAFIVFCCIVACVPVMIYDWCKGGGRLS